MRILQLGPYPPPYGGVAANLTAIENFLHARGDVCSVVAITRPESGEAPTVGNIYRPRSVLQLVKVLFRLKHDLVHLHIGGDVSLRLLGLALLCTLLPGSKSMLSFHSGGYPTSASGSRGGRFSLRGMIFRRFTSIVAVNEQICQMFRRFGVEAERVHLISPFSFVPPSAEVEIPEHIKSFLDAHAPRLVCVSSLEPEYCVEQQIDAIGEVLKNHPNAGLVIIGSGRLLEKIKSRAVESPHANHLLLCGGLRHDITLKVMGSCDVLLRTTLYDGDAISVREALHMGLSVVATNTSLRPDGVDTIPINDPDALAAAIHRNLTNGRIRAPGVDDGLGNIRAIVKLYEEII